MITGQVLHDKLKDFIRKLSTEDYKSCREKAE